ncbi:conserved hypothetical protein [Renibacterium salmoninarum ATCC 33209]|uniref:Antitoxin n=1 Tax=Renibacterium salmoninarum (strain ATCC 33209 / DSM 20767 / JCM 11484 / NBRC 15589 / NCIMB 2235) TaxID=288705 RepID=A9WR85_RENSM|nr:conserved hypothetical protein [Renibacterium salmoninarum ATCC 33209]
MTEYLTPSSNRDASRLGSRLEEQTGSGNRREVPVGLFDEIKDKAGDLVGGNKDALKDGIEKAGDFIDSKTGDKFKDQIDSVQSTVGGFVDKASGGSAEAESSEAPAEAPSEAPAPEGEAQG